LRTNMLPFFPWTMDRTVEKTYRVGATSWTILQSWRTQDSKNASDYPLEPGCLTKNSGKTVLTGLSKPKLNFSKVGLLAGIFHKIGIVEFNFRINWWVSLLLTRGLKHGNFGNSTCLPDANCHWP
jgi:hypothetical protein